MNVKRSASEAGSRSTGARLSFSIRPSAMLTVTTGPEWTRSRTVAQYVTSVDDPTAVSTYGGRYVFGTLDQQELSMTTRVSVIVTPTVSFQVYAQPLLAAGDYTRFNELAQPRTFDFLQYGIAGRSLELDPVSNAYIADPDGATGDAQTFSFDNPDFNLKSLRLNTVFRWEVKRGSTFYAVWTRQQEDTRLSGRLGLGRDARRLFSTQGDDVFLVKIAYWVGR
jgi:hypothetical protein